MFHAVLETVRHCVCIYMCLCVCVCVQSPGNQGFYKQIISFGMTIG